MRRGSNNGITMTRGPIRVNRPIGGPPVGHNIGGRPRPAGDPGPPRRRADPSDERIDAAGLRSAHGGTRAVILFRRAAPALGPHGGPDRPSAVAAGGGGGSDDDLDDDLDDELD